MVGLAFSFSNCFKFVCRLYYRHTVTQSTKKPKILRPGIIGPETIKKYISLNLSKNSRKIKSPGMLKRHYSPGIPIKMNQKKAKKKPSVPKKKTVKKKKRPKN